MPEVRDEARAEGMNRSLCLACSHEQCAFNFGTLKADMVQRMIGAPCQYLSGRSQRWHKSIRSQRLNSSPRERRVTDIALRLFDLLAPLHGLSKRHPRKGRRTPRVRTGRSQNAFEGDAGCPTGRRWHSLLRAHRHRQLSHDHRASLYRSRTVHHRSRHHRRSSS